jgi:hypothetical protein
MGPRVVLEWLEIAESLALDDRLRSAIIARDALRRAGRSEHGTATDDRPGMNSGNPDSESAAIPSPPHRTRRTPPTCPSQFSVSAFRLAGRGVF